GAALRTEHDVFQHGERIDQHKMLMHHADTERDGSAGAADVDGFSVNQDLAAIGLVKAKENAHKRRFAGAILADDASDRARRDAERNIAVRVDGAEALLDVAQLDGRR